MIRYRNLDPQDPDNIRGRLLASAAIGAKLATSPGVNAIASLYVPNDVANGDTVTFGNPTDGSTFEVDIINTDLAVNTSGALDGTSDPVLVVLASAPVTEPVVGNLIRIESEILKVMEKVSSVAYYCARARCGTAIATHVTNSDVFQSDAAPTTTIPVGLVTTLTPAAFAAALYDEFKNAATISRGRPQYLAPPAGLSDGYDIYVLNLGAEILFVADDPGVNALAVSEEFTNSTDSIWGAATFTGGVAGAVVGAACVARVPTAAEELAGQMHFAFPFTVRAAIAQMRVTATGQLVPFTGDILIGYQESTDVLLPGNIVTLRNLGPASTAYITPFAATHTITVLAFE